MYEETGNEQGLSEVMRDLRLKNPKREKRFLIGEVGLLTGDEDSVCKGDGEK